MPHTPFRPAKGSASPVISDNPASESVFLQILRGLIIFAGVIAFWWAIIGITGTPSFILPSPAAVAHSLWNDAGFLLENGLVTLSEILLGMVFGVLLGCSTALLMEWSKSIRQWMLPVLVTSQAVPVYALAPVLVLWFGFGIWPKVMMATLIIYFPVTAAFYDGLHNTERGWINLAHSMGARRFALLRFVRLPAALPSLASGIRVAAATAPIGAIVGEWVGASAGLGHVMNHSKATAQEPRMFAALFVLALMAIILYFATDYVLRRAIPWSAQNRIT